MFWVQTDSSVDIATGYGLNDRTIEIQFPAGGWEFFSSTLCPDRYWSPPASYPMGTGDCFPEDTAATA